MKAAHTNTAKNFRRIKMTEPGWTSEALLNEGKRLLGNYEHAKTQEERDKINGCFMAIQETLLAQREIKVE